MGLKLYCHPLGTQLLNVITLIHNTNTIRTQVQIIFNNVPLQELTYKGTSCGVFLSTHETLSLYGCLALGVISCSI